MPRLVIQQGHCYRTTGATGTGGEQQFATSVASRCVDLLDGVRGWDVVPVLADAPQSAYRGEAFVAVHADGSVSPGAHGASVGYQTPEGQAVAHAWLTHYHRLGWSGFRPDNYTSALAGYYGVRNSVSAGNRSAFILEAGFLTNPIDRAQLQSPAGVTRVATAIGYALGILTNSPDPDTEDNEMRNLILAREKEGAEGSSWPAVYVGNGVTCRHVANETDLANLKYRIVQAGGDGQVKEGWDPGTLFGVLGVDITPAVQP